MKGIRTNCYNGKQEEVDIEYEIRTYPTLEGKWLVITKGGVTGYESFQLTNESLSRLSKSGWSACAGTKNRWDTLFIPAKEMQKLLEGGETTNNNVFTK